MYVSFIDLLGFASAIERMSASEANQFSSLVFESPSPGGLRWSELKATDSVKELFRIYEDFQQGCKIAALTLEKFDSYSRICENRRQQGHGMGLLKEAETVSHHRVLVFSDSVFLASTTLEPLLDASSTLITTLLSQKIPVRGGIAKGQFNTYNWSLNSKPGQSFEAHAPFLGSGVLFSYRAESAGPRGIRLIVHKSCEDDIYQLDESSILKLPEKESSHSLQTEVNLALYTIGCAGDIEMPLKQLSEMRLNAPDYVKTRHYDPTIQAYHRMGDHFQNNTGTSNNRIYDWMDEF